MEVSQDRTGKQRKRSANDSLPTTNDRFFIIGKAFSRVKPALPVRSARIAFFLKI
jgi:hypothetical protein